MVTHFDLSRGAHNRSNAAMERLVLAAIVAGALGLRLWNLDQNGWGAEYYSSAVRSMAASWHNFLYVAFDPAGFISVDKPPTALWAHALYDVGVPAMVRPFAR